jgi:hypothetical protein
MTTSNNSQESLEKSMPKSPIAASRQLIHEYIRTAFPNPALRGNLLKVLKSKKVEDINDFYQKVSSYLSLSADLIDGPYADITEKNLREIGLVEIKNSILRESIGLENQVKTITHRIFSEWEVSSFTLDQITILRDSLMDESNYTLKNLIRSRDARWNFLNRHLGNTSNLRTVDFDNLCNDIAIQNPSKSQIKILEKWMNGYTVSEKEIGILLESLDSHTLPQKKSILQYFIPTVSLGFLLEYRILTREWAIHAIIKEIQKLYPDLSDDEILSVWDQAVDHWISWDRALSIQTSDLTDTDINTLWSSRGARNALSRVIESDLIESRTSAWNNELDLESDANNQIHADFLKKMKYEFSNKRTGISQVENIDNMIAWSVIKFHDPKTSKTEYYKVRETDIENEDGHEWMTLQLIATDWHAITTSNTEWFNYQSVRIQLLARIKAWQAVTILDSDDFNEEKKLTNIIDPIDTIQDLTEELLVKYIDEIDKNGKQFWLQVGNTITYPIEETGEIWLIRIDRINRDTKEITINDMWRHPYTISFTNFLEIFTKHDFLRMPKFDTAEDFCANIGIPGLLFDHGLKMKDESDHHGHHDDHWHGGDGSPMKALISADGKKHILIKNSDNDSVTIQVYAGSDKITEEQKWDAPKKFLWKKHKYYKPEILSYLEFAALIKNSGLRSSDDAIKKPLTVDPLHVDDGYTEEDPFHMHNNALKAFLNIGNVGDLMKAFEMSWHAFEHTMEKWQKINASKFMYRMFGKMDNDFGSQVAADYVEWVGETIEKIMKKIKGFNNGMKKRKKCLHLLQDKSSKPEEIAAALITTVEGSGGLYMDEPFVGYAGSWMWFNSLVRAAGYPDTGRIKAELADKVNEVNKENPTEEMYIEQFLKVYGELHNNPLVMAMWGYPKFRKTLIEWRKAEVDKWERDAGELLGIGDRTQLGINKMCTWEYPQVIGIYKSAMWKYAWWPADVIPWMWALSGATKVAHPNIANEFKNFTDAHGFTFHAISFCRNPDVSALYKRVVSKVVAHKLWPAAAGQFADIQHRVDHQFSHHHHRSESELKEYNADIMKDLRKFWDTHNKVLHPILQGTSDSYIFEHSDDPDFKQYIEYLNETHNYRGSGWQAWFNKDYGYVDGYKKSPSFGFTDIEIWNKSMRVRDIKRQLDWIRIHGQSAWSIENDLDTHIFQKSILPFLKNDISSIENPEQKEATYIANYLAIINWIREHLWSASDKEWSYRWALAQRYMQDLTKLGYDLSFETVIKNNINPDQDKKLFFDRKAAEASFRRFQWKNAWSALGEVWDTKARFSKFGNTSSSNDSSFYQAA